MRVRVGGIEAVGLVVDKFSLHGPFWNVIGLLSSNFGSLGYLIVVIFIASWIIAAVINRMKGYHSMDVADTGGSASRMF